MSDCDRGSIRLKASSLPSIGYAGLASTFICPVSSEPQSFMLQCSFKAWPSSPIGRHRDLATQFSLGLGLSRYEQQQPVHVFSQTFAGKCEDQKELIRIRNGLLNSDTVCKAFWYRVLQGSKLDLCLGTPVFLFDDASERSRFVLGRVPQCHVSKLHHFF